MGLRSAPDRMCSMQSVNLTHHFLIAMPNMVDPNFARSLTYICEHNEQGAFGLVVNRPIEMTLSADFPVYFGGPVQVDRGFVLHRPAGAWQSTLSVRDDVALTTSKDILEAVGKGQGPEQIFVSLGYSGWAAGQLEQELGQNAWLTVAADLDVVFNVPPEQRFQAAVDLLGIDLARLSDHAGHA